LSGSDSNFAFNVTQRLGRYAKPYPISFFGKIKNFNWLAVPETVLGDELPYERDKKEMLPTVLISKTNNLCAYSSHLV
jgi:hypothetical protein